MLLRHRHFIAAGRVGCILLGWWLLWCEGLAGAATLTMKQTYSISHFELHGSQSLPSEVAQSVLTNAIGPAVSLECVCQALAALRRTYQAHGFPQIRISLPAQALTNGVVQVEVEEGKAEPLLVATPTNSPSPITFAVQHFEVTGNTLLSASEMESLLQSATGTNVTLVDVRQAATRLQRAYRERGYVTVAVSLPSQRLTNATVHLIVTEGKLAQVIVAGNHHFSDENIRRMFPDVQTNQLLNRHVFQRELDLANANRDRQIYPVLGPGPEPSTSALTLRVKDRLPLHAHLELDNYATPGTPELRVNFSAQYNNLWQREQQAGLTYSFTPQVYKTMGNTPDFGLNQPLISSYSAFYRIPLTSPEDLARQVAASSRFGYQEATHEFLLPPAQGGSELTFYASASASDTGVKWAKPSTVFDTNMISVVSQDSAQSSIENQNVGGQFRFPLVNGQHSRLTGFIGADFKHFGLAGYSTNNFFTTMITTNQLGSQTNRFLAATNQPATTLSLAYVPINVGAEFSEEDTQGNMAASLTLAGNLVGSDATFAKAASSTLARAVYGKVNLAVNREQKLPASSSLLIRASGQAASGALIGNEQFALGGINSVRGYYEGDQYGDCGWTGSLELRSAYFETPVAALSSSVPAWLRASVFTDAGQKFLLEAPNDTDNGLWLWSAGFGLSANVNNHVEARITVAWPLLATANTLCGQPQAYFTIGGQF